MRLQKCIQWSHWPWACVGGGWCKDVSYNKSCTLTYTFTYNFSYKIIHHLIHLHIHIHIQSSKTHVFHHIHLHIQFHIEHPIILYREYKKNEQLYFLGSYWSYKNGKTFKFEYKTDSEHWAMHIWCINFKKFKMFHVEHLNIWLFYYVQLTQD